MTTPEGDPIGLADHATDPGGARERTGLAWTRSALNLAAAGTLVARGGFAAHLNALGVVSAFVMAAMAYLTWRHGRTIYRQRGRAGTFPHHQPGALALLTTATLITATIAIVVTIAI